MTEKPLTKLQKDIIFQNFIIVCKNCWYRAKSTDQTKLHLKETGHEGFHQKNCWELPWTDYKNGKFK